MSEPVSLVWFRRDLRLSDHPALAAAARRGRVVGVFVADEALLASAGATRRAYLASVLATLQRATHGALSIRVGEPGAQLLALAGEVGASALYDTTDAAPYGRERDARVQVLLKDAGLDVHWIDSNYVVAPGTLRTSSAQPYRVFTPFRRAWWGEVRLDVTRVPDVGWRPTSGESPALVGQLGGTRRPWYFADLADGPAPIGPVGELAAARRLEEFAATAGDYARRRNRPDLAGTSRLSADLRFGVLHPRQALNVVGEDAFVSEIAWREFYADVLWHWPESARRALSDLDGRLDVDRDEPAQARFALWARGQTGYPLVDAGMRQLLGEGWMHNRVRMVAASFLVKHLHLDWRWGARWFMWRLVDADLASNQHGWQWCAGLGTDAAPFHRIFNPTLQAERFDPDGTYIRRWVPELAGLAAPLVHQPGAGGWAPGYPAPMIDLAEERREALARWARARGRA